VHLDPATAVFEAMLEGWKRQQQTRFLKWESTVKPRLSLVRRFAVFTGQYPWDWGPAEVEAFFTQVRADNPGFTMSSGRQYQTSLRMFMDFICDPRYGWLSECQERFGRMPAQILHEWNSVTHVAEFEGQPGRRPLTYDEVQALFDAADGMAEDKRVQGRKGSLTAMRDAALLKAFYAWGLRRQEMTGLHLPYAGQFVAERDPPGRPPSPYCRSKPCRFGIQDAPFSTAQSDAQIIHSALPDVKQGAGRVL
jgi:integrase/recombinase XerD